MPQYSPATLLVWQVAAGEAAMAGHEFVEKEHLFQAALKLAEVVPHMTAKQLGLGAGDFESVQAEIENLASALQDAELNTREVRYRLRALVGRGTFNHGQEVVHRSNETRRLFAKIEALAGQGPVRIVHLLLVILHEPGGRIEQAFREFNTDKDRLAKALARSLESNSKPKQSQDKQTNLVEKFGRDLTALARDGKISPVIGRRDELLQVVRTLARKGKSNPLLVGDPGVGKTAVVYALALRIASGQVVPELQNKRVVEINLAGLVAGTTLRGQFEERVTGLIEELRDSPDIIIFLDEVHTIIGAGDSSGTMDAANIFKPALASGEINCIGATTWDEYRKYIAKDPALERRFQPVEVKEPTPDEAVAILEGLRSGYEEHHNVKIDPGALEAAVRLTIRYLPDRRLPDKAIDALDEACVRTKISRLSYSKGSRPLVTARSVAEVVAAWSGRPVEEGLDENARFLNMEETLGKRVIGQEAAIGTICRLIRLSRAGLRDASKPWGVVLLAGASGVGKTELAKALAEMLFGSDQELIRIDMSEFMEQHNVARLIGSPPGYVGHDEEGELTGKLRRKPHSVVVFDEMEKAHPRVLDLLLQLFDEGRITDAKGKTVDATSAFFIMTSNIGQREWQEGLAQRGQRIGFADAAGGPAASRRAFFDEHQQFTVDQVKKAVRPELFNRLDEVVVFRPLDLQGLMAVAEKLLGRLQARLRDKGYRLEIDRAVHEHLAARCIERGDGARPLARLIELEIAAPAAQAVLEKSVPGGKLVRVNLGREGIRVDIE